MASILIHAESRRLDMCTKKCTKHTKMKSTVVLLKFGMMVGPTKGMIYHKKFFFENVKNEGVKTKNGSKMVKK